MTFFVLPILAFLRRQHSVDRAFHEMLDTGLLDTGLSYALRVSQNRLELIYKDNLKRSGEPKELSFNLEETSTPAYFDESPA